MIINENYYVNLFDKYQPNKVLPNSFLDNFGFLNIKIILDHYYKNLPIHFNYQNSKSILYDVGKHLFLELANDIYLNHYDLPQISDGDKVKRRIDGEYYLVKKTTENLYRLNHILRKSKSVRFPADIPEISYDKLVLKYLKVDAGISEETIKNYFEFFEKINKEKSDFPKIKFEKKSVFITKKPLWDYLPNRNKIPCAYLPNPREENNTSEIRSIPALQDCLAYFTPKYDICYQNLLLKNEKIKTIVVFDTEAGKIEQMLQDRNRFGFNLIIVSNSYSPVKSQAIPCWNWFKEEIEIVNAL